MASGDLTLTYRNSTAFVVTNLQSLASSANWLSVWLSAAYDNSANKDLDVLLSGQFTVAGSGLAAGEIRAYVVPLLHSVSGTDVWPSGVLSSGTFGTEGLGTIVDEEQVYAAFYRVWGVLTDTNASRVYTIPQVSLMHAMGFVPKKFVVVVAQSTGQNFASSGNAVWATGVAGNVAA